MNQDYKTTLITQARLITDLEKELEQNRISKKHLEQHACDLQVLRAERDSLKIQNIELREAVVELEKQNTLNDRINRANEDSIIEPTAERDSLKAKVEHLEQEDKDNKLMIEHLQGKTKQLREENREAAKQVAEMEERVNYLKERQCGGFWCESKALVAQQEMEIERLIAERDELKKRVEELEDLLIKQDPADLEIENARLTEALAFEKDEVERLKKCDKNNLQVIQNLHDKIKWLKGGVICEE